MRFIGYLCWGVCIVLFLLVRLYRFFVFDCLCRFFVLVFLYWFGCVNYTCVFVLVYFHFLFFRHFYIDSYEVTHK